MEDQEGNDTKINALSYLSPSEELVLIGGQDEQTGSRKAKSILKFPDTPSSSNKNPLRWGDHVTRLVGDTIITSPVRGGKRHYPCHESTSRSESELKRRKLTPAEEQDQEFNDETEEKEEEHSKQNENEDKIEKGGMCKCENNCVEGCSCAADGLGCWYDGYIGCGCHARAKGPLRCCSPFAVNNYKYVHSNVSKQRMKILRKAKEQQEKEQQELLNATAIDTEGDKNYPTIENSSTGSESSRDRSRSRSRSRRSSIM